MLMSALLVCLILCLKRTSRRLANEQSLISEYVSWTDSQAKPSIGTEHTNTSFPSNHWLCSERKEGTAMEVHFAEMRRPCVHRLSGTTTAVARPRLPTLSRTRLETSSWCARQLAISRRRHERAALKVDFGARRRHKPAQWQRQIARWQANALKDKATKLHCQRKMWKSSAPSDKSSATCPQVKNELITHARHANGSIGKQWFPQKVTQRLSEDAFAFFPPAKNSETVFSSALRHCVM